MLKIIFFSTLIVSFIHEVSVDIFWFEAHYLVLDIKECVQYIGYGVLIEEKCQKC